MKAETEEEPCGGLETSVKLCGLRVQADSRPGAAGGGGSSGGNLSEHYITERPLSACGCNEQTPQLLRPVPQSVLSSLVEGVLSLR